MTKLERLEKELKELQEKQKQFLIKKDLIKASKLNSKIEDVKRKISECNAYEVGRLSDMLDKSEIERLKIYEKMVKISLAADFLLDCCIDYSDTLKQAGLNDITMRNMVMPIWEQSQKLVSMPSQEQYGELLNFMMEDDELIDDMHLLANRYLKQLNVTK